MNKLLAHFISDLIKGVKEDRFREIWFWVNENYGSSSASELEGSIDEGDVFLEGVYRLKDDVFYLDVVDRIEKENIFN